MIVTKPGLKFFMQTLGLVPHPLVFGCGCHVAHILVLEYVHGSLGWTSQRLLANGPQTQFMRAIYKCQTCRKI